MRAMPLDAQLETLIAALPNGLALPIGDPPAARKGFHDLSVALRDQQPPADLASTEDLAVPSAAGEQKARLYRPHADGDTATVLYFHGGGFVVGDIESYDWTARTLAERAGVTLLSVEYRLAPEHPFPAAVEDALAISEWAIANGAQFGGDAARMIVAGDSAGGNLAAVAAQELSSSDTGFAAQALFYPVVDAVNTYPSVSEYAWGPVLTGEARSWFGEMYVEDETHRADPRVSPLERASLAGLPPAIVATAGYDVLRDEGVKYAERLAEDGVQTTHLHYESLPHGFLGLAPLSEGADSAFSEVSGALAALA